MSGPLGGAALATTLTERLTSVGGVCALVGLAYLLSSDRRRVDWRLVGIGVGLQFAFAGLILRTPVGRPLFDVVSAAFTKVMGFTEAGTRLIFGAYDQLQDSLLKTLAFGVLPSIIFFSSLMAVLYHLGVMQRVVSGIAWLMQRTMRTSGSETLSAAANIFVGQTEAPLMIRPYVNGMTRSELMVVMVGGFATVAGGVMAVYVAFLEPHFPGIAGHLMAASVMSAPAALVVAKVMLPETEESETRAGAALKVERLDANVIDAAARGAGEGLSLMMNVGAMLLAFVALVAMLNYALSLPSLMQHHGALSDYWAALTAAGADLSAQARCAPEVARWEASKGCLDALAPIGQALSTPITAPSAWGVLTFEGLFGYLFAPLAVVIGVPIEEARAVGQLLGVKTVLNEFVAYQQLQGLAAQGALSPRSVVIASYALCGFANFGSIAIQIGGIGGLAPSRRADLARLGLRAMAGGTIAALMTAAVAGALL
jgi:CNT family concentrative nucleoside transporter